MSLPAVSSSACYVAPLLRPCGGVSAGASTIHDVPTSSLAGRQELALVVVVDPADESLLLRLPNELGWRCHFGCPLPAAAAEDEAGEAIGCRLRSQASVRSSRVVRTGTMLFSFGGGSEGAPPSGSPPMRVAVFQAWADRLQRQRERRSNEIEDEEEGQARRSGGEWTDWTRCPYDEMWADDAVWLPEILTARDDSERRRLRFEGHFVFDESGPGPAAGLLEHNCRFFLSAETA